MSLSPAGPRLSTIAVTLAILFLLPACTVEAGDEAAHALAEKFAIEGEPAPKTKIAESSVPPESSVVVLPAGQSQPAVKIISEPLDQPQPKTAAKKSSPAERKPSATQVKQAEAKRRAREKAEQEQQVKAQRKADEREMLARARAEAEERRIAQERRLKDIERAEAEAEAQRLRAAEEQARKLAEEKRLAEAEEARKVEEKRRAEEEARRLAEIAKQNEARRIAAEQERAAEERRKAEEARRLAEIAAQEEARRFAEHQRRAEEERARRDVEARKIAEDLEFRRAAEERRLAAERMLAEEEARRAAQARALADIAERNRQAELVRRNDLEEARIVRQELALREADREAEYQRLAERVKHIRETRFGEPRMLLPPNGLGGPHPYDEADGIDDLATLRPSSRVTILLLMEPGDRGIRRFNKTGDPIICLDRSCYVSQGAAQPAYEIPRGRAFGPGVALGSRAGSCSRSLTCVFRNVDLGARSADVQPIDLRVLRHDRRESRTVEADRTCRVAAGQLTCRRPVIADSYTLWIVPEAVAERAGAMALETAVRSDSFYEHSAWLNR